MQTRDAATQQPRGDRVDPGAATNFFSDPHNRHQWWQRLFAELLGTFLLTLVAAGADVIMIFAPYSWAVGGLPLRR